ncbi:hypothetical protein [Nocardioides convexus]|uniref:hypothetical protein n=1 Tax=Nocardioides convexus TaxID=2712224 RepID=UPI0024187E2A|nr:hypothetical protein [Nocardioides convexus]
MSTSCSPPTSAVPDARPRCSRRASTSSRTCPAADAWSSSRTCATPPPSPCSSASAPSAAHSSSLRTSIAEKPAQFFFLSREQALAIASAASVQQG